MIIVEKYLKNTGQESRDTEMSERSEETNWRQLTLSAPASPVKIFPAPAKAKDSREHVRGYSSRWPELLRKPGQDTLSSKMSPHSLDEAWTSLAKSYGFAVILRSDLYLLKLPRLVRYINENEYSSLPSGGRLWMTPKASDGIMSGTPRTTGRTKERSTHLGTQVKCAEEYQKLTSIPTPRATEGRGGQYQISHGRKAMTLSGFVMMWPTPRSHETVDSKRQHRNKSGADNLATVVNQFPTPTTPRPHDNESTAGKAMPSQNQVDLASKVCPSGGQLNVDWVSLLMGFPAVWTIVEDGNVESHELSKANPKE